MKTPLKYIFSVLLLSSLVCHAQITADLLKQNLDAKNTSIKYAGQVKSFYEQLHYDAQWIPNYKSGARNELLRLLRTAELYGLNETDYQYSFVESLRDGSISFNATEDSIKADIILTDAAIHFFSELAFGNASPGIGYNGLNYTAEFFDASARLSEFVLKNDLPAATIFFEPRSLEYQTIKSRLNQLLSIQKQPGFAEVVVSSNKVTTSNAALQARLYQLGFLDSAARRISEQELKKMLKKVQQSFNVKQEAILSKSFLNALNIPVSTRITELKRTLNSLRWLEKAKQNTVIVVNIPSATLLVYESGRSILESKIIVGKPSTPTPTFTSKVQEVVLYPYWMVPNKIAVKELLPSIKHNVGFLDVNNYQVLNRNGKVVNPYNINWQALSATNFPYILRQSTGCDNSLGIVKLNFYTPYSVFLHDTPGKSLFSYSRRYFSHGCIRVEKAIELAHLALRGNEIAIDTLEEKGCLQHQSPVVVGARNQMPVFVIYNTAWINSEMIVTFSEDIYKKYRTVGKKD